MPLLCRLRPCRWESTIAAALGSGAAAAAATSCGSGDDRRFDGTSLGEPLFSAFGNLVVLAVALLAGAVLVGTGGGDDDVVVVVGVGLSVLPASVEAAAVAAVTASTTLGFGTGFTTGLPARPPFARQVLHRHIPRQR